MKGARRRKKWLVYFVPRTPVHVQCTIDRDINLLVALYDTLLNTFFVSNTSFQASHKEQQQFRLATPDLAGSTHAYMHVSRKSDFDLFESNNLH